jgi:hypothetical protein
MVKTGPNLRDFRIDSAAAPEDSITQQKAPRQAVSPRGASSLKSSVQEWGSESWQGKDRGDLWQVWEEDEEFRREKIGESTPTSAKEMTAPTENAAAAKAPAREASSTSSPLSSPTTEEKTSPHPSGLLSWPAELALEERKMERLGVVDFSNTFKKQDLLKRQTREFMKKLRESLQREIEVFNSVRQSQSHFIHLYRVSNTEEDFMLFRNGVKLVVSGERSGHVVLAFNQYLGQIFTPSQQQPNFELDATWGAFDQVNWNYRGERVSISDIVRYFLGEFARQSYK